jgi:hypothetical protein
MINMSNIESVSVSFANLFDDLDDDCPRSEATKEGPSKLSDSQRSFDGVGKKSKRMAACNMSKKRTVSFAPCRAIHIVDCQTEGLLQSELWYSRDDVMLFEEEACLCSQTVQERVSRGSFDDDLGHFLGLEKILLCDSYYYRRDTLRKAVMDEQAVQRLTKETRAKYYIWEVDNDSTKAEPSLMLMQLARVSETKSQWARDQASKIAITLEHDLGTCRQGCSEEPSLEVCRSPRL